MKKPYLIFITILTVLFSSCQIDRSGLPKTINNPNLYGTWYLKTELIAGSSAGTAPTSYVLHNFNQNDFYKFNTDYTLNFSSSSPPIAYTTYYTFLNTDNGQTLNIGSGPGKHTGAAYIVNKLTRDSLILFNAVTANDVSGVIYTTNTTLMFAH